MSQLGLGAQDSFYDNDGRSGIMQSRKSKQPTTCQQNEVTPLHLMTADEKSSYMKKI